MSEKTNKPTSKLSGNFWKYWTGQTISNLGSSITLFALPLLVYKLTGSALNLGIAAAVNFLPYLLFGLILGAWSAIPLGSLLGGLIIGWTQNVALVYGGIGVLVILIPFTFSFTALGHAERYLPKKEEVVTT